MKPIAYCIFLFGMFTQMNAQVIKSLQKVSDKAHNGIQPQKKDMVASPLSLVNPFVGTGGNGHTCPGATAPFGMFQLSPETRQDG